MITGLDPGIGSSLLDELLTIYHNSSVWNICALHRHKCFGQYLLDGSHLLANSVSVLIAVERYRLSVAVVMRTCILWTGASLIGLVIVQGLFITVSLSAVAV
jgi:hypothetical protein